MQELYVLRNPVPNSYKIIGYFSKVAREKIAELAGIENLTWILEDKGVIVVTDGKIRLSDLLSQIKTLLQSK